MDKWGEEQGPFTKEQMAGWFTEGLLPVKQLYCRLGGPVDPETGEVNVFVPLTTYYPK